MSVESWITVIVACVQAGTAIVIVALTWRLVRSTAKYVATTKKQLKEAARARTQDAKTAAKQLATSEKARATAVEVAERQMVELQRSREAAIQPYVHVVGRLGYSSSRDSNLAGISFFVYLMNVGIGPALDVRAVFRHAVLEFRGTVFSDDLPVGGGPQKFELGVTMATTVQQVPLEAEIWVDCRDLLGRWWATDVPVRLDISYDEGRHFFRNPVLLDQQEQVRQIAVPRIQIDGSTVEDAL